MNMTAPPLTTAETLHAVRTLLDRCVISTTTYHDEARSDEVKERWCLAYLYGPPWEEGAKFEAFMDEMTAEAQEFGGYR